MSNEDTYVAELKKIVDGFNRELPRVPGVINGAASAAKRIMFWDQDYVERKRQEAQLKFGELQQEANNFITACEEECGMVVTAKSLRGAADAFEAIDFTKLRTELGWKPKHDDLEEIVAQALSWEKHLRSRNS